MNLQIDQLDNQLATCPSQTGWKISIEPYPHRLFGCIDDLHLQYANRLVSTQTGSDGPEQLLTLGITDKLVILFEHVLNVNNLVASLVYIIHLTNILQLKYTECFMILESAILVDACMPRHASVWE